MPLNSYLAEKAESFPSDSYPELLLRPLGWRHWVGELVGTTPFKF